MGARIVQTINETTANAVLDRLSALHPGIDLVEIRLDALDETDAVERLVAAAPVDVLATARRADQGGGFRGTEAQRIALLHRAAAAGATFVDLEEDVPWPQPARDPAPRIIRSFHDFSGVPDDLEARARALARDADIVKVACMPRDAAQACRLLSLPARIDKPTVAIGMGSYGQFGRIAAGAFGMPLTYAASCGASAAAPGQVAADRMVEIYRAQRVDPSWRVGLMIGGPSPANGGLEMIDRALGEAGQSAVLASLPVASFAALRPVLELEPVMLLLLDGLRPGGDGPPPTDLLTAGCQGAATRGPLAGAAGAADLLVRDQAGWHALNLWGMALRKTLGLRGEPTGRAGTRAVLSGDPNRARMAATALDQIGISWTLDPPRADGSEQGPFSLEISFAGGQPASSDSSANGAAHRLDAAAPFAPITTAELTRARLEILWDHLSSVAPPADLALP